MTSVKELGDSLRKRQVSADGAGPGEEFASGSTGKVYTVLLVVGGCVTLALGALLAAVDVVAPDLRWMAESLERMGIKSGAVLVAGISLLGLGMVCKALSQMQRALLASIRSGSSSPQITEHQEEIRDSLAKVHFALRVLQESTKGLLEVAHEQSLKRESNDHEDAVFHLAASLDQLGVRLEDRLDSQQSGIERRLGTLDAVLEETRCRITEWLELGERVAVGAARDGEVDQDAADSKAARDRRSERSQGERPTRAEKERSSSRGRDEHRERTIELSPSENHEGRLQKRSDARRPDRDDELEVVVTLEDDHEDEPVQRRERAPRRAQPSSPTSLGVLDVLDDFGDLGDDFDGEGASDADSADSSFLFDAELAARLEHMAAAASAAGNRAGEAERTQEKLAQLQALLADTNLRKALDGLRRTGGSS